VTTGIIPHCRQFFPALLDPQFRQSREELIRILKVMMIMMMGTRSIVGVSLHSSPFHIILEVDNLLFYFEKCMAKQFAQLTFNARWIENCTVASLVTVLCCTHISIAKLCSPEEQNLQRRKHCNVMATTQQQFFPIL
jgi:hypothetical protein